MFPAEFERSPRNAPGGFRLAAEHLVEGDEVVNERPGGRVSGLVRARQRFFADRARPFYVAQNPACRREVACCGGAGVRAEPEHGVAITLGIVCPKRLGEIRLCADKIALPEARCSQAATRDRRLGHPPLVFGVPQEALRGLLRQAKLAAHHAADK